MQCRTSGALRRKALGRILDLFPNDRDVYENWQNMPKYTPWATRTLHTIWTILLILGLSRPYYNAGFEEELVVHCYS